MSEMEEKNETVSMDSTKGKEAIDNLMKTLPPEEAKKLQDALNSPNPPHVHVDEKGNVFVGDAADKALAARKQHGTVSSLDVKRAQVFEERVKRWLNKHEGKSREQAIQALHQEDMDKMPVEQKLKKLEQVVFGAVNGIGNDVRRLEHNQFALADAMDVNLRAVAKLFRKLGVDPEVHKATMLEARQEIENEMKTRMEAQKAAMEKQAKERAEAAEKKEMVSEAKTVAAEPGKEAEGAEIPKDATVFGG